MFLLQGDPHAGARFWLTVADTASKTIFVLVGAGWTLMYYLRGRIHKHKPIPEVTARLVHMNGEIYLSVMCRLKNIGLTKYPIQQKGSAWRVWALTESAPAPEHLVWVGDIFKLQGWMEPGGQIDDPQLLKVALTFEGQPVIVFRVGLRSVSGGIVSSTSCIVEVTDEDRKQAENPPVFELSAKEA